MFNNLLYFAILSVLHGAPDFICPIFVATAISAIVVSSRARRFVKTLARRVVARSADNVVLRVVAHLDDVAVPARDD